MQIQFIEYRIWAKVEQVEKGQILTKNSVYGYFKGIPTPTNKRAHTLALSIEGRSFLCFVIANINQ